MSAKIPQELPPPTIPVFALIAILLPFIIYLLTLYPNVPGGDSGELINAAYNLTVAHPPGYPLHTLLGKAFTLLPFNSIAWRVNLLAAVCSAFAAGFLFLTLVRLTRDRWASLTASLLFSFSPLIWEYSVGAEVFALNNLLITALLYLLTVYDQTKNKKYLYGAALVAGLGLSNQHAITLYVLPLAIFIIYKHRAQIGSAKEILKIVALGLAGLLPYMYLPLAAMHATSFTWGDLSTWDGFLYHFFRREYGTLSLAAGKGPFLSTFEFTWDYLQHVPLQMLMVGVIFVGLGLRETYRQKQKDLAWAAGLALVLYLIVLFAVAKVPANSDLIHGVFQRFWMQPNIILFLFLGVGLAHFLNARSINARTVAIALTMTALLQIGIWYRTNNHRNDQVVHDFIQHTLETLPTNAIYLSQGDQTTFPMLYVYFSEKIRPDVKFLAFGFIEKPWAKKVYGPLFPDLKIDERFDLMRFLKNHSQFSIFTRSWELENEYPRLTERYDLLPYGSSRLIAPKGSWDLASHYPKAKSVLPKMDASKSSMARYPRHSWSYQTLGEYWESRFQLAKFLVIQARQQSAASFTLLPEAITYLREFETGYVGPIPHDVYLYLGEAHMLLGPNDPQHKSSTLAAFKKYLELAPKSDRNYSTIQNYVLAQ